MGLDEGHMPFARMGLAVPPAYASIVATAMARHCLLTRYGVRFPSFDELLDDPSGVRSKVRLLRRGAGASSPDIGLRLESRHFFTYT